MICCKPLVDVVLRSALIHSLKMTVLDVPSVMPASVMVPPCAKAGLRLAAMM